MAGSLKVSEGSLLHGMPYLAFGAGRPLLLLRGFMTVHANPVGLQRRFEIRLLAPLARHFRVFAVGRAPGMPSAASMADLALEHAEAIGGRLTSFGTSTTPDVVDVTEAGPAVTLRVSWASCSESLPDRARPPDQGSR